MTLAPIASPAADIEQRRSGLGGTDVARILGLSRFGGPMDVYLEKIGQAAPLIETEPMRWGKILEPSIAEEYAARTGRKVRRAAAFVRHPAHPEFYANIDRWSLKGGTPKRVLECKTTSVFTADDFGEEGTDQVPADYLVQCQWYLGVTGAAQADLAVLIGGNRFRVYEIPRDKPMIAAIEERALDFWVDTQKRIPPPIDGSDAAAAYLKATYRDKGTERPMDDELLRLAMEYKASTEQIKQTEQVKAELGNRIRDLMGDHHWSEGEGVKVVYGERQAPARTDWDALCKAHGIPPAAVSEFTTRGDPTRTLTITIKPA